MRYRTPITLITDEPVTQIIIAHKVATVLGEQGVLRPGEGVQFNCGRSTYFVLEQPQDPEEPLQGSKLTGSGADEVGDFLRAP